MLLMGTITATEYINPIKEWYDTNLKLRPSTNSNVRKYSRGMMISISNHNTHYNNLLNSKLIKNQYISIIKAVKGKDCKISKWDLNVLNGDFNGDRIKLPSREGILKTCANETPIMICGVHNYKKDNVRSYGVEYSHQHFFLYNIHYHLPTDPIKLRSIEGKIEKHLYPYSNYKKRVQGIVRITEVGVGAYQDTDNITPLTLYDYLRSPITNPDQDNIINYISNNRHLPTIQYPLTTIYLKKKL